MSTCYVSLDRVRDMAEMDWLLSYVLEQKGKLDRTTSLKRLDSPSAPGKVHVNKICFSDGWLTSPAECLIMAETLERLTFDEVRRFVTEKWNQDDAYYKTRFKTACISPLSKDSANVWYASLREFAEFCRYAASVGGFTSH